MINKFLGIMLRFSDWTRSSYKFRVAGEGFAHESTVCVLRHPSAAEGVGTRSGMPFRILPCFSFVLVRTVLAYLRAVCVVVGAYWALTATAAPHDVQAHLY